MLSAAAGGLSEVQYKQNLFITSMSKVSELLWTWIVAVVKVTPLVQPHLDQAGVIVVDDLRGAPGKRVRRRFPEHMADPRTRRNLQHPATHPNLSEWGMIATQHKHAHTQPQTHNQYIVTTEKIKERERERAQFNYYYSVSSLVASQQAMSQLEGNK